MRGQRSISRVTDKSKSGIIHLLFYSLLLPIKILRNKCL